MPAKPKAKNEIHNMNCPVCDGVGWLIDGRFFEIEKIDFVPDGRITTVQFVPHICNEIVDENLDENQ
jgi:hypothetical protein